ncbi:MAG: electron transfer flavoprotein subunit alpha [Bacteroidetes bacterium 47-18]|nr:MAG: electron transfer flavoprotein subunit alpha [Bacteroidetes bacterium 47-18]
MSVLVFVENNQGSFKKKTYELINYAAEVAKRTGGDTTALVLGQADDAALAALGNYGAVKVLHDSNAAFNNFGTRAFSKAVIAAAQKTGAKVIITNYDVEGKSIAGYVAAALKAGLVSGAVDYPVTEGGFTVKKTVFSGKAFANITITSDIKVVSLVPNTFPVQKTDAAATVEAFDTGVSTNNVTVKEVNKVTGAVPLGEAELVVSGGRGLKGPENWGIVEDLASALGAALACSRPVADAHWRPHHEHVGQTGGTIRPNLYVACGISGAIQHLAGVNSSKCIVVINKDPEAPFFKAADYGVVGDVFEILPKLTEAVKKFKAGHA